MSFPFSYEFNISAKSNISPNGLIEKIEDDLHSWKANEVLAE